MNEVKLPGCFMASHAVIRCANAEFTATVEPIDQFGIVKLTADGLIVGWSAEQWAAVIPVLWAALPAGRQVQVIEAIHGAGVSE